MQIWNLSGCLKLCISVEFVVERYQKSCKIYSVEMLTVKIVALEMWYKVKQCGVLSIVCSKKCCLKRKKIKKTLLEMQIKRYWRVYANRLRMCFCCLKIHEIAAELRINWLHDMFANLCQILDLLKIISLKI